MEFQKIGSDDPELAAMVAKFRRAEGGRMRAESRENPGGKPGASSSSFRRQPSALPRVVRQRERAEDREKAFERWVRDERALRETGEKRSRIRAKETMPSLVAWLAKQLLFLWTAMVTQEKRFDQAILNRAIRLAMRVYTLATSFALAHALLFVGPGAYRARQAICGGCTYRKIDDRGVARCYGAHEGTGCGCLELPWWFFSRLGWKLSLRNFRCPLERFGRWSRDSKTAPQCSAGLGENLE